MSKGSVQPSFILLPFNLLQWNMEFVRGRRDKILIVSNKKKVMTLFTHEKFDVYDFEEIPLNRDIYIMDEAYIREYEESLLHFFDSGEWKPVGYISYASVNSVNSKSAEISLAVNIWDRYHHVNITLPREEFVACVGSSETDEKPHLFVKTDWHNTLYLRNYSIFALIDVADFKKGMDDGLVKRDTLLSLRDQIDELARGYENISFISFADSLLLKSNWTTANFRVKQKYTYSPEIFIDLSVKINKIYSEALGLSTYAIITQGSNEYYDDPLLHISESQNHVCLNSLGIPFAQLMEIEATARGGVREGLHPKSDLYMDGQYFYSLNFKSGFEKNSEPYNNYKSKMMTEPSKYYYSTYDRIIENLENAKGVTH